MAGKKGVAAYNRSDLSGKKFGMLSVIGYKETRNGKAYWDCVCDCGKKCEANTDALNSGKKKSCGCQQRKGKKPIDITGQRFGRLVVLGIGGKTEYGKLLWKCKCDCGNTTVVTKEHLGVCTNSCGCLKKEVSAERTRRHGEAKTRLHDLWCSIRQRCTEGGIERSTYFDRGIKVCDEWQVYENFRDWAMSHGYDPNAKRGVTTIDRIDNDKGYSPDNCRFVTQKENARNKRNTLFVTINGETIPLVVAAEKYGKDAELARGRIYRGWEPERALMTPPRKGRYKHDGDKRVANY